MSAAIAANPQAAIANVRRFAFDAWDGATIRLEDFAQVCDLAERALALEAAVRPFAAVLAQQVPPTEADHVGILRWGFAMGTANDARDASLTVGDLRRLVSASGLSAEEGQP